MFRTRFLSGKKIAIVSILLGLFSGVNAQQRPQFVEGEVIVKFRDDVVTAQAQTIFANASIAQLDYYEEIRAYRCNVTNQQSVAQAVRACQQNPSVEYAEPNYIYTIDMLKETPLMRAEPNDPAFSQLYGMNNIDAVTAWDVQTGNSDLIVGVIDTGVDYEHEDLAANMWRNPGETGNDADGADKATNGVDDDGNGYIDDVYGWDFASDDNDPQDGNGHGTHVAGTIGAVGNNETGVVGVNWNVSIMALRFLDNNGSGTTADAIPAIVYAADMGVLLTNNSWGGGGFSQALKDAIEYARDKNSLFVAAAGNSNLNNDSSPSYPASYDVDNIISVAASDRNDNRASFSNFGKKSVHLAAPGVGILSCEPNNRYQQLSGTSMASPHVAGAVALVATQFSGISYTDLRTRILGTIDPKANFSGNTITGGRLNVNNAFTTDPIVALVTRLEDTKDTDGPYSVSANATDDGEITSVTLHYSAAGGAEETVAMAMSGNLYEATVPGQSKGTNVSYYVKATDNDGNTVQSPVYEFKIGSGRCGSMFLITSGDSGTGQAFFFLLNFVIMLALIKLIGRIRMRPKFA